MKDLKILAAGLALLAWSGNALAQNEVDALRYSQLGFGGTARMQGLAGAQNALGADASTMSANPAGLGLYRKSEFTFSPGLSFNENSSQLNGIGRTDSRNNFNIPQFGIVFTDRKADDVSSKWRSGSFGIGFTRLNSFQSNTSYEAPVNENGSILESFLQNSNSQGRTRADFENETSTGNSITTFEGLAYATYLLDFDQTVHTNRDSLVAFPRNNPLTQREFITTRGSQNQWDFSYGASYLDKLFIGGSLSPMTVRFEQQRAYTETAAANDPYFTELALTDEFTTRGSGINFRIGAIYKPVDAFRIGGSIQTPTFMGLTDNYSSGLKVKYKPGAFSNAPQLTQANANTMDGTFDYNLTTPFRANGGMAYFIGKYGFISGDVEYVNYPNARLGISDDNAYGISAGGTYFQEQNTKTRNQYQGAVNLRFGAEARMDIFRLRAGFARYGDPFRNSSCDRTRNYYTAGIGLKEKNYFLDAAYVFSKTNSYYSPYTLENNLQPVVSTKNNNTNFVVTAGFNF